MNIRDLIKMGANEETFLIILCDDGMINANPKVVISDDRKTAVLSVYKNQDQRNESKS